MNSIINKEPVKRAEKILKEFDPNLKVIILEDTARTANDAATALGCNVGAIVKSLLFKTGETFCLCLISGDKRCSLNKLKKKLSEKDVSMAKPEEVKLITGYTIGGVSPIGHLVKIKIFIDENLGRFSKVFAAAGHPNAVFGISYVELKRLTGAEIDDVFSQVKTLYSKNDLYLLTYLLRLIASKPDQYMNYLGAVNKAMTPVNEEIKKWISNNIVY